MTCKARKTIWPLTTANWYRCRHSQNAYKMRCTLRRNRCSKSAIDSMAPLWEEAALRPSQQVLLQAQQALLNAQIDQQRKSLEGNTVLQDTLQKQRDYVTAHSNRLEHQLQLLQEAVNSKRLTLTEKTAGSGNAGRSRAYSVQSVSEAGA